MVIPNHDLLLLPPPLKHCLVCSHSHSFLTCTLLCPCDIWRRKKISTYASSWTFERQNVRKDLILKKSFHGEFWEKVVLRGFTLEQTFIFSRKILSPFGQGYIRKRNVGRSGQLATYCNRLGRQQQILQQISEFKGNWTLCKIILTWDIFEKGNKTTITLIIYHQKA